MENNSNNIRTHAPGRFLHRKGLNVLDFVVDFVNHRTPTTTLVAYLLKVDRLRDTAQQNRMQMKRIVVSPEWQGVATISSFFADALKVFRGLSLALIDAFLLLPQSSAGHGTTSLIIAVDELEWPNTKWKPDTTRAELSFWLRLTLELLCPYHLSLAHFGDILYITDMTTSSSPHVNQRIILLFSFILFFMLSTSATAFLSVSVHRSTAYQFHKATNSLLFAKKKKSSSSPNTSKKTVQVKLLKHIAGTGQAGDVITVTPAFYNNKLRPQQAATIISDDEVLQEQQEQAAEDQARTQAANKFCETWNDQTLHLQRKAGPEGQLFGGINVKTILQELEADEELRPKIALTDGDGKKIRGDIKHTGEYGATVSLTKDVSVKIAIVVEAD